MKKINVYLKYNLVGRNDKAFIALSRYVGYKLNVNIQFHIVSEVAWFIKDKMIITDEQDENYNIVRKSIYVNDHPDEIFLMVNAKCRASMLPFNVHLITNHLKDKQLSGVGNVRYIPSFTSTTILDVIASIFQDSYFEKYDEIKEYIQKASKVSNAYPHTKSDDLSIVINAKPILNMLIQEASTNPNEKLFKRLDRCLQHIASHTYPDYLDLLFDVFEDERDDIDYLNLSYFNALMQTANSDNTYYHNEISFMLSVLSSIVYKTINGDFKAIDDNGTTYYLLDMSDIINTTNLSINKVGEIPRLLKNTTDHKIIFMYRPAGPLSMTYIYSNFIKPYSGTLIAELAKHKSDEPDNRISIVL